MCKNMYTKCDKYESIFIFRETEEFEAHLASCSECRAKYDEMMKIENLVRNAKPAYFRNKEKRNIQTFNRAVACFAFLVCLSFVSGNYSEFYTIHKGLKHPEISQRINNSIFNQMKLPTDEFGLLDPNKELAYE